MTPLLVTQLELQVYRNEKNVAKRVNMRLVGIFYMCLCERPPLKTKLRHHDSVTSQSRSFSPIKAPQIKHFVPLKRSMSQRLH